MAVHTYSCGNWMVEARRSGVEVICDYIANVSNCPWAEKQNTKSLCDKDIKSNFYILISLVFAIIGDTSCMIHWQSQDQTLPCGEFRLAGFHPSIGSSDDKVSSLSWSQSPCIPLYHPQQAQHILSELYCMPLVTSQCLVVTHTSIKPG